MNNNRNCLVLTQYRQGDLYNDFIGNILNHLKNIHLNIL